MKLVDTRRLMGPNLLARVPLVIVQIAVEADESVERCFHLYTLELERMRQALGLAGPVAPRVRAHRGGAVFAYEAPIDVMLAWAEMSEWAAESAALIARGEAPLPLDPKAAEVAGMFVRDRSPRLLAIAAEAERRGVPLLWDDTHVTVGLGCRSETFPREAIPDAHAVRWDTLGRIPVALVSGTNGKTTSSRLLARIASEAGFTVGGTSTDGITVGGKTIEEGDWTGPAAARTVLRRKDVDFAVLETARGGILRRGLALDWCDAALITNVTDDHLGDYGIDDVAAMTRVKGVIAEAVTEGGTVVLNAHDPNLMSLGRGLRQRVAVFADLERGDATAAGEVAGHREAGGTAVVAQEGLIVHGAGMHAETLVRVDEVPIAFGGAARHNVENALGVAATALALGIGADAIGRGLRGFGAGDNPGRAQLIEKKGVRVMLDFGHNPDGIRAVVQLVARLREERPGRLTVVVGSAGDRSDGEVREMARAVVEARPDEVFVRDLTHYLRGRAPGEVPRVFLEAFDRMGYRACAVVQDEVAALERVFAGAEAGHFVLVLAHVDHAEVTAFLER